MNLSAKQITVILLGCIIVSVLYLLPVKNHHPDHDKAKEEKGFSIDQMLQKEKSLLSHSLQGEVNALEARLNGEGGSGLADSLALLWEMLGKPVISAYYNELSAIKSNTLNKWIKAGENYFEVFRTDTNILIQQFSVSKAIDCYKKALEINPDDADAKSGLGICYAEGTPTPMEGIKLLREVAGKYPEHEQTQLALGILSMRSGQYQKAVERFEKVLKVNSKNFDVYLRLAEALYKNGEKEKAINCLRTYKNIRPDSAGRQETEKMIQYIINN